MTFFKSVLVHRQELNVVFGEVFTEVRKARKVRCFLVLCYLETLASLIICFANHLFGRPSVKQDSKSVTEY
jgi:hypothetical protein